MLCLQFWPHCINISVSDQAKKNISFCTTGLVKSAYEPIDPLDWELVLVSVAWRDQEYFYP